MLKYSVTQEDFLEMARFLLKKEQKKFGSVLKVILSTVVQMAAIAYLITLPNSVQLWLRIALAVLSVAWACLSLYRYFFVGARARQMLARQKKKDPNGDFWKDHRLEVRDDMLKLSYGATRAEFDCRAIGELMESEHLYMLAQNGHAFEILPKKTVKEAALQRLMELVRVTGEQKEKEEEEAFRSEVLAHAILNERLPYSEEEMVRHLVRMKRLGYGQLSGWSPISIVLVLVPVFLIVYFAMHGEWDYLLFSVLLFLVLNGGQIAVFLPLYKNVVRSHLPKRPEEGYLLVVSEGCVYLFAEDAVQTMPSADAKEMVDDKDTIYLYFKKQRSVCFPRRLLKPMQRALQGLRSIRDIAGDPDQGGEGQDSDGERPDQGGEGPDREAPERGGEGGETEKKE